MIGPTLALSRREGTGGSALIITLSILVLVVILVVGMITIARLERVSANNHFESQRAKAVATIGVDNAVALIRQACDAGSQPGKFWSSQPGKVTVFNADGSVDAASTRYLFSTNTGSAVNLNQAGFSGIAPIASANSVGAGSAPSMSVNWVSVLQDPGAAAGTANPIVGRYAFWVDDEGAKLNVNTADGTAKANAAVGYGPGTPTEISLTALRQGSATLSAIDALAIAKKSGAQYDPAVTAHSFNDPSEILQASGVATNVVTDNNFNTTVYNRAPEQNIFGEPRIYLMVATTNTVPALSAMTGPYAYSGSGTTPSTLKGGSLIQAYPQSNATAGFNQLPNFTYTPNGGASATTRLPQYFQDGSVVSTQKFSTDSTSAPIQDYDLGMRIAHYLKGIDGMGNAITWPTFPGSGTGGFAAKYTDRQIDSIALQILALVKQQYVDHYKGFSLPYVMPKGFLSGKPVTGLARGPRLTEVVIKITTLSAAPAPKVAMQIDAEWYLPKEFTGSAITDADMKNWGYGIGNYMPFLNYSDAVQMSPPPIVITGPSPLGGYWMDNMLTFLDQGGAPAGVDLFGNDPSAADKDQTRAEAYHNYPGAPRDSSSQLYGSGPVPGTAAPMLSMYSPTVSYGASSPPQVWQPGDYRASMNVYASSYYPMKAGVTSLTLGGGIAFGLHTAAGGVSSGWNLNAVPLDSVRGLLTEESLSTPSVRAAVLQAVLAMPNVTIPIPGQVTIHMQVTDPLVNNFPGDWVTTVNPASSEITMAMPAGRDPTSYTNGQNTIAAPAGGCDPAANWWPTQSVAVPKSQRFPSAGYLQYVRTGLMPDYATDSLPIAQQKGTPFRVLNFSPSTAASQQTAGGASYPDWAMLDLFTVPAALQPLGNPAPTPLQLTWGGATVGRMNPNSLLLPFTGVSREVPLEGLFKGLQASTSYDGSGAPVQATVDETALAQAVNHYLGALGRPFLMPGEICNVPELATYVYSGGGSASASRNDLIRQIIGNLSTRSNTFCVWAMGQVIKKAPSNTGYGVYETGDTILGGTLVKVVVERTLDPGADGVFGNTQSPGVDGVAGTPDDPVDATYHPAMTYPLPFKYRIISMQEIVN